MTKYEKIGNLVKETRESKKLSQQKLADAFCVDRSTVSHIESGNTHNFDTLLQCASVLGIEHEMIYIYCFDENPSKQMGRSLTDLEKSLLSDFNKLNAKCKIFIQQAIKNLLVIFREES